MMTIMPRDFNSISGCVTAASSVALELLVNEGYKEGANRCLTCPRLPAPATTTW